MDSYEQLETLLALAAQAGFQVRRASTEGADHPGGAVVRLRDRQMIFLDPAAAVADQAAVVASALRGCELLEGIYLPPQVRELIDG